MSTLIESPFLYSGLRISDHKSLKYPEKNNTKKIDKKPIAITSHKKLISFFPLSFPQRNHSRVSKIPAYSGSYDVSSPRTEKLKGNKTKEFKNHSFLKKMRVWQYG